jgi:hypothetical protein
VVTTPGIRLLRRATTGVVGGLLTLIGVVLLVLPGPGFVLIALGLAVLAREFTWAAKPLLLARQRARDGLDLVANRLGFAILDAAVALALVAVAVADLVVGLPLLDLVSDVFLILSGLFLVATVIYARVGTTTPRS